MEEYFKRLKEMLSPIYESGKGGPDSIYESLIIKHEREEIHSQYSNVLNNMCLYLCYKSNGLDSLTSRPLPFSIESGLDFISFSEKLEQLKLYHFHNEIIGDDNYYNLLCRALDNKRRIVTNLSWKSFSKSNLEGDENSSHSDFTYKLYVPVSNSSLEHFATRLLAKCSGKNIDYDFKINDVSEYQRPDNVVIYATSKNFRSYIDIVSSILEQDKSIKLSGQQHPFAFPYVNGISVAPYAEAKGKSFSSIVCNKLSEFMNRGYSFEQFYSGTVDVMNLYHKYLLKQMNNDGIPLRGCEQKNPNSINNEGIGEPY